jgi:hypothetical protein
MRYTPAALLGAALLGFLPGAARADFISWSYNWSRTPGTVFADGSTTSFITLTDEKLKGAVGDSDIVATNLRTFSDAPRSNPAQFTNKQYTLSLFLLDKASGRSGTLFFTGEFNGDLSELSANITNAFTSAITQVLVLGRHKYTVTIGQYSPPGPQGSANAGSISAHAVVRVDDIPQAPEPTGLALAGLGLPALVLTLARRRRR